MFVFVSMCVHVHAYTYTFVEREINKIYQRILESYFDLSPTGLFVISKGNKCIMNKVQFRCCLCNCAAWF